MSLAKFVSLLTLHVLIESALLKMKNNEEASCNVPVLHAFFLLVCMRV